MFSIFYRDFLGSDLIFGKANVTCTFIREKAEFRKDFKILKSIAMMLFPRNMYILPKKPSIFVLKLSDSFPT